MKMIVGLGNPGVEYRNTRHNVGFMMLDSYAEKNHLQFSEKFNGLSAKTFINGEAFLLLKPLSYMNLSGTVVKKYADYYHIKPIDIFIIQDDLDLPVGKIKIKYKGSCGGHNGIRNIIDNLKTEMFPRFKVGIGKSNNILIRDYVIGKFSKDEQEKIHKITNFVPSIIEDFITKDIEKVMSKYNGEEYEIN